MSIPLSSSPAYVHLKNLAVGNLFALRCDMSLSRTLDSLPPWYIIDLFWLANSYLPLLWGMLFTFSKVNLRHLVYAGIIYLSEVTVKLTIKSYIVKSTMSNTTMLSFYLKRVGGQHELLGDAS